MTDPIEARVILGVRRLVHNAAILLGVSPSQARAILISILQRLEIS